MRARHLLVLALAVLLPGTGLAQQQQKRQLKDLFNLEWMLFSLGKPMEETGETGKIRLAAGAPLSFTSNANQAAAGGPSDFYFGPWVLGEWTGQPDGDTRGHAGAMFSDYLYMRTPSNNYAYAEIYTGLERKIVRTDTTALGAYGMLFCDYDLTSDWKTDDIEPGVSAGLTWTIDDGLGNSFYLTPGFTFVQALPASAIDNSYAAANLTAGWSRPIFRGWTIGAYWSGSASRYPFGDTESDFTQYAGLNLEWQMTGFMTLVFSAVETDNWSTTPSSDYGDFTAGASLRTSLP